jgi:hypothetical protein
MKENQIISWIFLAIAMASKEESIDLKGICMIADGINHAVPTERELKLSISWLITNGLIEKAMKKYKLTKSGMIIYNSASLKTNIVFEILKNIEMLIEKRL